MRKLLTLGIDHLIELNEDGQITCSDTENMLKILHHRLQELVCLSSLAE